MVKYRYSGGTTIDISGSDGRSVRVESGQIIDTDNESALAEACAAHPDFRPVKSPKSKDTDR